MQLRQLIVFLQASLFIFASLTARPYQVLGIGAPCMDILMKVDPDFIELLGNKGGSQQTGWKYFEDILSQAKKRKQIITTGGSCSNTIKGLQNYKHPCAFFGKMGRDEMGRRYLKGLINEDITSLCIQSDAPTQLCACLITPDGDRTMRCFPGAANDLTVEDLSPELFMDVDLVHIEGYMLYVKDKHFLGEAMRMAKQAGTCLSLDLSSFELVKIQRDRILDLLKKYVDIVFANADEIHALLGLDPLSGCHVLKGICNIAVVMIGKDGCLVGSGDKVIHCPASPANVIDTTGAGDLFASGFLHGYLQGASLEESAHVGNRTGAAVCEVIGAEIPKEKWMSLAAY